MLAVLARLGQFADTGPDHMHSFRILLLLACVGAALPACRKPAQVGASNDEIDFGISSMMYTQMLAAVTNAQATVPQFLRVLTNPAPNQARFQIKKPFGTRTGSEEHLWIGELTFDGTNFHGRLVNQPMELLTWKKGDAVTVLTNELSDWLYREDGLIVGGFTLRVMRQSVTGKEAEDFDRKMKFKE